MATNRRGSSKDTAAPGLGIEDANRRLLERLHRRFPGPFGAEEATRELRLEPGRGRRLLAYLAERGWLARVRRGWYVTVPLGARAPREWRADPWQVAAAVLGPGYVGGWSACEHWGLTEQLFRDLLVVTARRGRGRGAVIQGASFRIKRRPLAKHFGLASVWRGEVRVPVSDPERTLVDLLDDPALGGGIRHVAEVLASWAERDGRDERKLIQYAERLGNRTVFKRLGFLIEALRIDAPELVRACLERRSAGLSKLDPGIVAAGKINKRWNLKVNAPVIG